MGKIYKDGLSGIMRVKNEARFISDCIDSCIDALDELIVVFVDCTDDTEAILKQKKKQYPRKLRIYEYNQNVLWFGLTKEEKDYAFSLPENSPRLYSSVCNSALSHVRYKYAVKIDADQTYFTCELKKWRDVCANPLKISWKLSFIIGWLFMVYFSIYRRCSIYIDKPCLFMLPDWLVKICYNSYRIFSEWQLIKGHAVIALSGLNVFKDDCWYVPFDCKNIHPPYNGEGDTVIFKVSDRTFYTRHPNYNSSNRGSFSVTENFNMPVRKIMFTKPVWFHQHANRDYCKQSIKDYKDLHPDKFVLIDEFLIMSYKQVHEKMDKKAHSTYQRALFAFIHKIGVDTIKQNLPMVYKLKI